MPPQGHKSDNNCHEFPYEIVDVDDETYNKMYAQIKDVAEKNGVFVGPKKYFLSERYKKCYLDLYNFQARPDDILLLGFPRSGTTLHSEMVWQIEKGLDFETVKDLILMHRFPVIDLCLAMGDLSILADQVKLADDVRNIVKGYGTATIDHLVNCKEKRFLRSHLPISLLSPSFFQTGCKVIFCARNPKDLVVSYYHVLEFFREKESEGLSFEAFWRAFKNNWIMYSPYFSYVKEAWEKRNDKNFLFLFYEDTAKDLKATILKVAEFLGKELSEDQQNRLVEYLKIDTFKKNKSVNCQHICDLGIAKDNTKFIRNGGSGGWRKFFVGDLKTEVDEWIKENLKDTDLRFPED